MTLTPKHAYAEARLRQGHWSSSPASGTKPAPQPQEVRMLEHDPEKSLRIARSETFKSGKLMPHIEARDITLVYDTPGRTVPGVRGVSFGIEASEFLCIVGPSG